jgi:hypothetical protein
VSLELPRAAWELADMYAMTFGTDSGRAVLRDLEQKSGIFEWWRQGSTPNPNTLLWQEGRRGFYLEIREQLTIAKDTERKTPVVTGALDGFGDPAQKEQR